MFDKLFAIALLVDNFNKSLEFYHDRLGLEVKSQDGKFANFKLGETELAIFEKSDAVSMFPAQYMKSGGGAVLVAYFLDPDGNIWEVSNASSEE